MDRRIGEHDFFAKSTEFRVWLREFKGKYLDEMETSQAKKYFRSFVKAYNSGGLPGKSEPLFPY